MTVSHDVTAYYNGVIYTADPDRPTAQAFIVKDGRFALVGDNGDVQECAHKVDLGGRCVIPGLVDSHCHAFAGLAKAAMNLVNIDPETRPEALGGALLAGLSQKSSDETGPYLAMGICLKQGDFSARDIDDAISDRPVVVFSEDGHALLLNTEAMRLLGIDRDTRDPGGNSYFCRDSSGNPTGLVIEIQAMMRCRSLVDSAMATDLDPVKIMGEILNAYAALGYTTLFEAMSADDDRTEQFEILRAIEADGGMPLRLSVCFGYHGEDTLSAGEAVACLKRLRDEYASPNLFPETLKLFTDGTIEEHTALLFEPYADTPGNAGSAATDAQSMSRAAALAAAEGFHIHIHAIGDRGVSRALDTLCALGPTAGTKTIAHNQLYRDADLHRIADAGDIFFQTTPHWVESDDYTLSYLGEERYRKQFPVGTMVRSGVTVSFGSDSFLDADTANPFHGMYDAVARGEKALEGCCFPPLSEGISRLDSLYAYTINGARQLGLASETGSITAGKSADFAILDRDIMHCTLQEMKDTRVEETYFRGISR